MPPSTIGGINRLPEEEKRQIYSRVIPRELLDHFNMPALNSIRLQSLLKFDFEPGSTDVEMSLFHELRFPDPILYGHLTDTMNGQIHVLLYILNDPELPALRRRPDAGWPQNQLRHAHAESRGRESSSRGWAGPGSGTKRVADAVGGDLLHSRNLSKVWGMICTSSNPSTITTPSSSSAMGWPTRWDAAAWKAIMPRFSEGGELLPLLDGSSLPQSPKPSTASACAPGPSTMAFWGNRSQM